MKTMNTYKNLQETSMFFSDPPATFSVPRATSPSRSSSGGGGAMDGGPLSSTGGGGTSWKSQATWST